MAAEPILTEQIDYYRAMAGEYDDRYIELPGGPELLAAFDGFEIAGEVLELACGPGAWTERLVTTADLVTAVDASPEMIARAQSRVGDKLVRFVNADLFSWKPGRRYDAVFFGFWLSHVPEQHFEAFWELIADCLVPNGQFFFVDDNHRTEAELIEGTDSPVVERLLNDGTAFRAIKVPHQPSALERRIGSLGWDVTVSSAGPFYWGTGRRRGQHSS